MSCFWETIGPSGSVHLASSIYFMPTWTIRFLPINWKSWEEMPGVNEFQSLGKEPLSLVHANCKFWHSDKPSPADHKRPGGTESSPSNTLSIYSLKDNNHSLQLVSNGTSMIWFLPTGLVTAFCVYLRVSDSSKAAPHVEHIAAYIGLK